MSPNSVVYTLDPCKRRRWLTRIARLLTAFGAMLVAGYVFRAPLLTSLARTWVVDEQVTSADAIVILGGGPENRPFAAARLFHAGVAPLILYMDVKPGPAEALGVVPTEEEQTRRILLSNSVPESAMCMIGTNVASTYDESCAVRKWAKQTGAKSIVITTDLFHTRRARWIFRKELRDTNLKISLAAVESRYYGVTNWWQQEQGVIDFQNEIIKSVYYRLKY